MYFPFLTITIIALVALTTGTAIPAPAANPDANPGPDPQNGALLGGAIGGLLNGIAGLPLVSNLAGNSEPIGMTTDHSPSCLAINRGTLMCCKNTLDGGNAAVQLLSTLAGYALTKDTINGILCKYCEVGWEDGRIDGKMERANGIAGDKMGVADTCAKPSEELCCQVVAFVSIPPDRERGVRMASNCTADSSSCHVLPGGVYLEYRKIIPRHRSAD
jgi:hypothetical protein